MATGSAREWDPISEIDKFDLVVVCHYYIFGLDVSMCQTNFMQLMKSARNFQENISTIFICYSLAGIVKEVNEFDSLHVFHEQITHVCVTSILLPPYRVFDEVMVLWDAINLVLFHKI